jgi:hypothetical protein
MRTLRAIFGLPTFRDWRSWPWKQNLLALVIVAIVLFVILRVVAVVVAL